MLSSQKHFTNGKISYLLALLQRQSRSLETIAVSTTLNQTKNHGFD